MTRKKKITEAISNSITKFTQIERKIPKENIFTLSVLVGWASRNFFFTFSRFWMVGLVAQIMVLDISNSFYVVFTPLLAPITNFIQIGQKTQKLEIFTFGRFWLVGLVGRKMVAATSNIRNLFRGLPKHSVQNLNQIGQKLAKLAHREIFSQK